MSTPLPLEDYWDEILDLTIFDAAFWMATGDDPRQHRHRYATDSDYAKAFDSEEARARTLRDKCELIASAVRAGAIPMTAEVKLPLQSGNVIYQSVLSTNPTHSRIEKLAWIRWCRKNQFSQLADRFAFKNDRTEDALSSQGKPPRDWRDVAREIADEYFDHDTEQKTRDSLAGYSKRVMDEMQKRAIHGPRGLIDNPKTIQRDALQSDQWWRKKKK